MPGPEIKIGDWVRFYKSGALVIGQVEYIRPATVGEPVLQTDQGEVASDMVLETRRAPVVTRTST